MSVDPLDGPAAGLKESLAAAVDRDAARLAGVGDDIFAHPELAYQEFRTADVVARELRALGLPVEEGLARTGVRARLRGARPGPAVCVLAELDALHAPDHPAADPSTGAAHACGHNAQVAHLVGVARALTERAAAGWLAGDVVFFAVPAEEYSEIGRPGVPDVEFPGGKQELIRLGCFDGVGLALMAHATGTPEPAPGGEPSASFGMAWHYTGFATRRARFRGRSAHASSAPGHGVDSLSAARVALHAIDAQREAFAEDVRVHPVLRPQPGSLNVIAEQTTVDILIRGRTSQSIADAERRVDRSLRAGALAVGAAVELSSAPGFLPLDVDRTLGGLFRRNALALAGEAGWAEHDFSAASTDAGDLSHLMPVMHATHGGCAGVNHSARFRVVDPVQAYVQPAKAIAWTVVDLLHGDAATARAAIAGHRPRHTRTGYVDAVRATARHTHCVEDVGEPWRS
ncbi:amidohydrolase [Phytohabitans suffuscus]|uniref:Amidohydrolase n=1 Tax=Phytohabitans suffuscus TaxID=624315 RepID=A0A6F8YFL9_9ACTN|nr:amidohydrolase [Phytohabitans suffuscus]BCB84809.1 amidohydrolase [Phytohabitans suffuscus]